jgi:hypothetical protein
MKGNDYLADVLPLSYHMTTTLGPISWDSLWEYWVLLRFECVPEYPNYDLLVRFGYIDTKRHFGKNFFNGIERLVLRFNTGNSGILVDISFLWGIVTISNKYIGGFVFSEQY